MNKIYSLLNDLRQGHMFAIEESANAGSALIEEVLSLAKRAVCFNFGEADLLAHITPSDDVRLPFPVIWVEFDSFIEGSSPDDLSRARIAALIQEIDDGARYEGFAFMWNGHRWKYLWMLLGQRNMSDLEWTSAYFPNLGESANQGYPFGVVFRGCTVMRCTNVYTEEERPGKMVAMRARKNKLPLFSTWTLHLKLSGREGKNLGGTHASPRVHLRRGHVRQYAPGLFTWVQPCVVGKKELGIVHKDYALLH